MRLDLFRGLIAREQRQSAREHECHARKAVVRRRGRALKIHACLAQAAQHVLRLRACKIVENVLRRRLADIRHGSQVFKLDWLLMSICILCVIAMLLYALLGRLEAACLKRL